jgi:hypothetical protein
VLQSSSQLRFLIGCSLIILPFIAGSQTIAHFPVKVAPTNNFVIVQLPEKEFLLWANNYDYSTDAANVAPITRQLYKMYKDDFDMIIFVIDQSADQHQQTSMPWGINNSVSNSVAGIGINPFDETGLYGSAGKLKSCFVLWARTYMEDGPFLHEFAHNWCNFLIPENEFSYATPPDNDYETCGSAGKDWCATKTTFDHWGFAGCGGQLGGFEQSTLKENVDDIPGKYHAGIAGQESFGFNANGGNSVPYSKFELYLMGMVPLDQVPPFDAFSGVKLLDSEFHGGAYGEWNGKFFAATRTTYTPEKILKDFGARNPTSSDAQKDFKALVVLVTNKPLASVTKASLDETNAQLTDMSLKADNEKYGYNFWEATGGIGSIDFTLPRGVK